MAPSNRTANAPPRPSRPPRLISTPSPHGEDGGKSPRSGRHGTTSDRREMAETLPGGVQVIDDLMCPRIGAGTAEYEWMTWQEIAEEARRDNPVIIAGGANQQHGHA